MISSANNAGMVKSLPLVLFISLAFMAYFFYIFPSHVIDLIMLNQRIGDVVLDPVIIRFGFRTCEYKVLGFIVRRADKFCKWPSPMKPAAFSVIFSLIRNPQ